MNYVDLSAALSNSLSLASILILLALGLSITFGVMKVINMAHGDMVMLGAYTAVFVRSIIGYLQQNGMLGYLEEWGINLADYNLLISIPMSFLVVGFVGWVMEVCLIRFLYGRPLDTLLATWGVGMAIQQFVLLWFGANLQPMNQPPFLSAPVAIGPVNIPSYRIFIVVVCAACLFLVYIWFYWTSFGLKIRAVVQNRPMASACGISTRWVDSLTFAFATGLAGVAGCMLGHLWDVKYNMGNDYIVEAFMVVILGGLGKLVGSVGAGTIIGFSKAFLAKYLPLIAESIPWLLARLFGIGAGESASWIPNFLGNEMMAQFLVLSVVIIFLIIRPQGLFTTKERSYE